MSVPPAQPSIQLILMCCMCFSRVGADVTELPDLDNAESERTRTFIQWLNNAKPYPAGLRIVK